MISKVLFFDGLKDEHDDFQKPLITIIKQLSNFAGFSDNRLNPDEDYLNDKTGLNTGSIAFSNCSNLSKLGKCFPCSY